MERKCKSCGKWFNVGAFSEEYCPYCGTVLDKEDRQKIKNRDYFLKRYLLPIIIVSVIAVFFIVKITL